MKSFTVPPLLIACLVAAAAPVRAAGYPDSFVQADCFNWYSEKITGIVRVFRVEKKAIPSTPTETISIDVSTKPFQVGSDCKDPKFKSLSLSFRGATNAEIALTLVVRVRDQHYWYLDENRTEVVVTANNKKYEFSLKKTPVTAGHSFSFSCSQLRLHSGRATVDQPQYLDLVISRFQLQPFNATARQVFADSFDCATWFTIPLWTGFLVTLLFTAILSFGVFALLNIKTPDRFENPKGKTITVSATD